MMDTLGPAPPAISSQAARISLLQFGLLSAIVSKISSWQQPIKDVAQVPGERSALDMVAGRAVNWTKRSPSNERGRQRRRPYCTKTATAVRKMGDLNRTTPDVSLRAETLIELNTVPP